MHNIYIEFWGERKVMKKLSKYDKKKGYVTTNS